jgi:hypothetical protein
MEVHYDSRYDAQVLADAEAIKSDSSRYAAAQMAAGALKSETEARLKAFDMLISKVYNHPDSIREREKRNQASS